MLKEEILARLNENVTSLIDTCRKAGKESFFNKPSSEKWSAAQNVRHLVLAVRPLNLAFSLPLPALRMFGTPARDSASFEDLTDQYMSRLGQGAKASAPFIPRSKDEDKEELIGQLSNSYSRLASKVRVLDEKSLDRYFLPHPILGRITIREMLYFTVYHVHHHHEIIRKRLNQP